MATLRVIKEKFKGSLYPRSRIVIEGDDKLLNKVISWNVSDGSGEYPVLTIRLIDFSIEEVDLLYKNEED
jgi:hypothetical protein